MIKSKMVLQRIMWRSVTGYTGSGDWISSDLAAAWLDYLKKNYPNTIHWVETR
jgi:hypothetical protein